MMQILKEKSRILFNTEPFPQDLEQDLLLIKKYSKELMDLQMKLPMFAYGIMDQVTEAFIQAA